MPISDVEKLEDSNLLPTGARRELSLWVLPGVPTDELAALLGLPWVNIWNAAPDTNLATLWRSNGDGRRLLEVSRPEQDYTTFRVSEFVRIYNIVVDSTAGRRQQRFVERLKDRVELLSGILCIVGDFGNYFDDLSLIRELAPDLSIILFADRSITLPTDTSGEFFRWADSTSSFAQECARLTSISGDRWTLDLKDARGVKVDTRLLEDIEAQWTLLDSSVVAPPANLQQTDFDDFLNGGEAWPAIAAGVPFRRNHVCFQCGIPGATHREDFVQIVMDKVRSFENASLDPGAQLEQILLFAESGSGTSTLLRQTAMALAGAGFPTLISKPYPSDINVRSLEEFIIDVQNKWRDARRGKGTGTGLIPVCLLIDTDGESALGESGIARALQALGRKIVIIRAMERSKEEIESSKGPYGLVSDVSSDELVALGRHLRSVAETYGLEPIPSDAEWQAFHAGVLSLRRYAFGEERPYYLPTPALFLIGISPFVKERVLDENSIEQYYYRKWSDLNDENAQGIVRVLAAAGVYGLSVPFETLLRHPDLDVIELNRLDKTAKRTLEILVQWTRRGHHTQDWYLHSRHSAIAAILSKMIDPSEESYPFTALVPLLENLSTKESDLWFARTIAFRLGQYFKSRSPRFTLETDTAPQRAARAIFSAIPADVKAISRTVRHHQGRYHIHALRACTICLNEPKLTTLSADRVAEIAAQQFAAATEYLEMATQIEDQRESISNIFNTLATAHFTLADALRISKPGSAQVVFDDGLDCEDRALKHDAGNGHALYQYVRQIVDSVNEATEADFDRSIEILSRAEMRLIDLIRLHEEDRWRNVDPIEAEKQVGGLVQDHLTASTNVLGQARKDVVFQARHPEAVLYLQVRELIGSRSLEECYRIPQIAEQLRDRRAELAHLTPRSTRSDLYLYQLLLTDFEGRLKFQERLDLLQKLKRDDPEQFSSLAHDEATLYCQMDQIDIGAKKLAELRQYRRFSRDQWFWRNERALVDATSGQPRELTLQVTDHIGGWARVLNTNVRVKYQPYQFGELRPQQVFTSYIRFTLNSLQAVTEDLIAHDIEEMGLA